MAAPHRKVARAQDAGPLAQLFRLDGRVALLTGAAGHLGKHMALALGYAGALVLLNGRHPPALTALEREMHDRGLQARTLCFDVTEEDALAAALRQIEQDYAALDIIVNNASAGRTATVATSAVRDFEDAWRIAVTAAFRIVQLARPLLAASKAARSGGASVINIASMYGTVSPDPRIYGDSGADNPPFYGSAKAGLLQLTRYLACHLAGDRIRVNAISPGPFPPAASRARREKFFTELERKVPLGRIGEPSELSGPLLFLASDAASYVTGANIAVDGGWTAW